MKNRPLEPLWFMRDETGVEHQECVDVAERIRSLIESREHDALESVIVPPVPDVYNNSVYLLVDDASREATEEIMGLIGPAGNVSVRLIEAPVPREVLFEWAEYVYTGMEVLRDRKGVGIFSAGITLNGTIYVGMEEVTPRNVNILLSYLKGCVPPGILIIRRDGFAKTGN